MGNSTSLLNLIICQQACLSVIAVPDQNLASAVGYGNESQKKVTGDAAICSVQIQHWMLCRAQSLTQTGVYYLTFSVFLLRFASELEKCSAMLSNQ